MAFVVFFMMAVPVYFISLAAWWALVLLFGVPAPTPDQAEGLALAELVVSQILAAVGFILWG